MSRRAYVEWDGDTLRVALYDRRRRRATLEYCAEAKVEEGKDWSAEAIRLLHSAGAERVSGLTVVLGRALFTLREFWVPDAPENELPGVVRFQAARELAVAPEKAKLDYVVLAKRETEGVAQALVLVALVDDPTFDKCVAIANALECDLSELLLRPLVLARGASQFAVAGEQGTSAVLYRSGGLLEVVVCKAGRLSLVRSVRLVGDDVAELRAELLRTSLMAEHHPAGGKLTAVLIPGPSELSERWRDVAEELQLKAVLYDPFAGVALSGLEQHIPVETRASWAPLAAVVTADADVWPLNVARPKLPVPESRLPAPRVLALAGVAAVLLLGLGSWTAWSIRTLDAQIEERKSHQKRLDDFLRAAAPLLKKHQAIDTWLGNGGSRVTWLHVLADLTRAFPGTDRVYVDSLSMRRAENGQLRVTVEGYARSPDDVAEFHVALNEGKRFRARPRGGVQRVPRRTDYVWRFESEITVSATGQSEGTTLGARRGSAADREAVSARRTAGRDTGQDV